MNERDIEGKGNSVTHLSSFQETITKRIRGVITLKTKNEVFGTYLGPESISGLLTFLCH